MSVVRITDPAKTLERCYDRLAFARDMLAHYEANGMSACAAGERRKIAGLKATDHARHAHVGSGLMGEGYAIVMSPCFGCGRTFGYNPHKVPSIMHNGTREPICLDCVERANPKRIENGLDPIVVLPGAYEPISEGEL